MGKKKKVEELYISSILNFKIKKLFHSPEKCNLTWK
jgi:hypothetical protein